MTPQHIPGYDDRELLSFIRRYSPRGPGQLAFIARLSRIMCYYASTHTQPPGLPLDTHCFSCGAYLQGGATVHHPGCTVQALIDSVTGKGYPK